MQFLLLQQSTVLPTKRAVDRHIFWPVRAAMDMLVTVTAHPAAPPIQQVSVRPPFLGALVLSGVTVSKFLKFGFGTEMGNSWQKLTRWFRHSSFISAAICENYNIRELLID